ncbi:MAG: TetR/AcrR family transcriptional regulator [Alphaproteobacteria bacterium]|nr:TetR/AcrR family transcriptional regulator [Alphaproteobacteria bacterium]
MQKNFTRRSNKERTEATRAALIAAARMLFVDKGYADTSTPEIVNAAKVTRGALYHHFADKADLFRAVVEREAQAVAEQIERNTTEPTSALNALASGATAYFNAMAIPGRVRLLLLDGPYALGHTEMHRIDQNTGGEKLRQGLAFALDDNNRTNVSLDALADVLSAAFDRAALAITDGKNADEYKAAIQLILNRLLKPD